MRAEAEAASGGLGGTLEAAKGPVGARATIDLGALRANAAEAARLAAGRHLIGVVKADAYGHGAGPVARALAQAGCSWLATWSVAEATALREGGVRTPLLVLGGLRDASEAEAVVAGTLVPVLHDAEARERLVAALRRRGGAPAAVHVEIDTGMRRMGVPEEAALRFVEEIAATPELRLAGVMTHFARADEADLEPTRAQLRVFATLLAGLRERGLDPGLVHTANSAGLVASEALAAEGIAEGAVRPGLMLYGAQPSEVRSARLRPVMSLRAPVVALRRARRGEAVGYAARYRAPADTWIATLGLGYADAVPVAATGRGSVWLAGALRPFAGRVSMDSVCVELGPSEPAVRLGDEALFFGSEMPSGAVPIPVEEAAKAAQTLSYELLVRVGGRVRREILDAGGAG